MNKGIIYIFISIVISLTFLYVCLLNSQSVDLNLGLVKILLPLSIVLIGAFSVGFLAMFIYKQRSKLVQKSSQKQLEWKAQDAKLMATIASDKEKLLEAKIATLETALKAALKKNEAGK